jgi:hypothetical protein
MPHTAKQAQAEPSGPRLYRPPAPDRNRGSWRINGFAASIFVWTQDEWDRLSDRPADAQYYSCGIWCALRLDD